MTTFANMVVDVHTALRCVDASDTTLPQTKKTIDLVEDACWTIEYDLDVLDNLEHINLALQCYLVLKQVRDFGFTEVVSLDCLEIISEVIQKLEEIFSLSPFPDQNKGRYFGGRPTRFEHILKSSD